jgi:hypothetical protein
MRFRFTAACLAASLVVGLGWQAGAVAHDDHHGHYGPHGPVITTNVFFTSPGQSVQVRCRNFAPDEVITLTLHSPGVTLGTTTSNDDGTCSTHITIPRNTTPGEHTIVGTGAHGDSSSTEITVVIKHHHGNGNGGDQSASPSFVAFLR